MPASTTTSRPGFVRRHPLLVALLALVVLPAGLLAAWAAITLSVTYSRGDRIGYNQKFSRKGWLCKTWEGELAMANIPGQAPELFYYSVRDDRVAERIRQLGGQRIAITYKQHRGVPTRCFGETEYFATSARPAGEAPFPSPFPGGAGAAPAVPPAAPQVLAPTPVPAPAPATPAAPR
jgi:hypothetical protein